MSPSVILFFRKKREDSNFSIERSFEATQLAFEQLDFSKPHWHTLSHYSIGILPRIRAMHEAYKHQGAVNHVSGDVNFLVMALPRNNTILTVLDCGFLNHPNKIVGLVLKWLWLDLPVRHVKYITAISESTRQEVIKYTGCNPEKIRVIPVVITSDFYAVEKPFNESQPRFLHIGTAFNKNLTRHIEALSGIPCTLHIIGKLQQPHIDLLEKQQINYINEYELSAEQVFNAYKDCDALLFASTLEGFGMPILEAQTIGRPVITGNVTSMPEVAGEGAVLVDPFDVQSIRSGILKVIQDPEFRKELCSKGFENVNRYQALSVAKAYSDLYREVIETNSVRKNRPTDN